MELGVTTARRGWVERRHVVNTRPLDQIGGRPLLYDVALVQEHCFHHLEAPIERVTGWDTPYPHAQEWAYFPGPKRIAEAFHRVMER